MGNGLAKFADCLSGGGRRRHDMAAVLSDPCFYGEGLGHSFCYVRPDTSPLSLPLSSSKVHHHEESSTTTTTTTFRSISGASVSANTSTTPFSSSSSSVVLLMSDLPPAAAFDCSHSFSSVPLQPIPRQLSGPLSGTMDRGFFSGPIERAFMSGPLDPLSGIFSGPLPLTADDLHQQFQRSFSHGIPRSRKASALLLGLRKAISKTITRGQNTIVAPVKGIVSFSSSSSSKELEVVENEHGLGGQNNSNSNSSGGTNLSGDPRFDDGGMGIGGELQWAQGKAGEDRVHVVISEEHGWVFVGIYDGFNGPDAPDYLLSNLYPAIHAELKGLLWEDNHATTADEDPSSPPPPLAAEVEEAMSGSKRRRREENQRRWKCEWDRERVEQDRKLKEQFMAQPNSDAAEGKSAGVNHSAVLKALATALQRTEETFLGIADNMVGENPELALMGSCVLVMLMKGEDVYLLNVGDSRAVLGHKAEDRSSKARQDLERMKGESPYGWDEMERALNLEALQLTVDHTACAKEEVHRIRTEHPDDALAVSNDRVKGSLKVTRAFGAGFLKQPKWNNALLEVFRIYYVGTSPYITCNPSMCHRRLSSRDRFLILSSDGLYQYFTNQEAVAEVEMFITTFPDGDPAQHLIEEVLYRAAKEAGLDFHELLQIPQGDRRRYHDDISVIVISLEGRIWRSCV